MANVQEEEKKSKDPVLYETRLKDSVRRHISRVHMQSFERRHRRQTLRSDGMEETKASREIIFARVPGVSGGGDSDDSDTASSDDSDSPDMYGEAAMVVESKSAVIT